MSERMLVLVFLCDFAATVGAIISGDERWFVVAMFSFVFTLQALRDRSTLQEEKR